MLTSLTDYKYLRDSTIVFCSAGTILNVRALIVPKWWFLATLIWLIGLSCPAGSQPVPDAGMLLLDLVADGFTAPVALVESPDTSGRLFVADQVGVIHIITNGSKSPTPFLDLRGRMIQLSATYDERGLLGLAFHPEFRQNGRFFVYYNAPSGPSVPAGFDCQVVLSEFRVSLGDPNRADPDSEHIVLSIPKPQSNHNGGQLAFGSDGYLYVSVGDGGGANDNGTGHSTTSGNGQDLGTLLGKVIRIDVNNGDPYAVPADNPFVNQAGVAPEIFAFGFRNPWRFSFDLAGTHRMFLGDVGQGLFEEIDIVRSGGNYGWRIREGSHCFDPNDSGHPPDSCPTTDARGQPLQMPIIEYAHAAGFGLPVGTAVIGGFVYRGPAVPILAGRYVYGDFTTQGSIPDGRIYVATEQDDGSWSVGELHFADRTGNHLNELILAFGQDQNGELFVLTSSNLGPVGTTGKVYRISGIR